jgi:hypothetical protein
MANRRGIGILVAALGGLLVAAGLALWARSAPERAHLDETRAALEDSARVLREDIIQTSLRYQAFNKSVPTLPDTMRMYAGGVLMKQGDEYAKKIRLLEMKERDVNFQLRWAQRRARETKKGALLLAAPLGAAGLVALIAGLVLARTARVHPVGA